MFKIKKNLITIILLLLSLFIVGCNKKEYKKNQIEIEEIFFQEEDEYYVYFYKDGCIYCDDIFDIIKNYIDNPVEKKLYVCKLEITDSIYREYHNNLDGEGQGPNGYYYVDYITVYTSLWISGAPSLIRIDERGWSFYVASGRKDIKEYFENLYDLYNTSK